MDLWNGEMGSFMNDLCVGDAVFNYGTFVKVSVIFVVDGVVT